MLKKVLVVLWFIVNFIKKVLTKEHVVFAPFL